jgi:NitT/TauT family transport system permease protein
MRDHALARRHVIAPDGALERIESRPERAGAHWTPERITALLTPPVLLALWEAAARLGMPDTRFFPPPTEIIQAFWRLCTSGVLPHELGITLLRSLIGFGLGLLPALVLGLTMGLSPLIRGAVWPIIGALYPIPKIAVLPLIMLLFGLGESSKWVIVAVGVFFPVLINAMVGVLNVEAIYYDVGISFGASRINRVLTIALPGAMPMVLAGVRLGWGVALLVVVAAEFVAAKSGIGYMIWTSWQTFEVDDMYVGIAAMSITGFCTFVLLDALGKLLAPWQPSRAR